MKSALLLLLLFPVSIIASDIKVTDVTFNDADSSIMTTVSWSNAWNNEKNHDAAWLFFKAKNRRGQVNHITFDRLRPELAESNTPITMEISSDNVGLFLYAYETYRGSITAIIRIKVPSGEAWNALKQLQEVGAFGIEMVYIPEGPFVLGEPGTAYLKYGGLYTSDHEGNPTGLFRITSEEYEIPVGPVEDALYYQAETGYEGDREGPIPKTFPKGYKAFYIMKYEPTQGQYVDFLNTLSEQQSQHRANFGGKGYYRHRGSIRIEENEYVADNPERPCNYMSWDDAMAYADWAGLRPMTEFEYVKASRGPLEPVENEFPWNSSTYKNMKRVMTETGNIMMPDESQLTDENREVYGASYYWVMDLAGSMWERVVSIGSEKGRSFVGSHGDGRITGYGFANNENWPGGVDDSGFGYRGGGYYAYPMEFTEFNPYSPIAYRRYGGWAGGNRTNAYGARFGRTAD
jgi:formylglycine-generating enzyme required for sulfatase activity